MSQPDNMVSQQCIDAFALEEVDQQMKVLLEKKGRLVAKLSRCGLPFVARGNTYDILVQKAGGSEDNPAIRLTRCDIVK